MLKNMNLYQDVLLNMNYGCAERFFTYKKTIIKVLLKNMIKIK